MRMNFGERIEIEDLGRHSAGTMVGLGILLAGTVEARPDHKRKGFYEVEDCVTVYYIYVSQFSGKVSLVASWKKLRMPVPRLNAGIAAHAHA
jgi:hypothetical protein